MSAAMIMSHEEESNSNLIAIRQHKQRMNAANASAPKRGAGKKPSSERPTSHQPATGGLGLKTMSLHDPEFKNLITVPLDAVHHLPPAHLEISRLVLCRKYDPRDPDNSCQMGEGCKFVHLDLSTPELKVQSIHVNYAYRTLEDVPHERLPAGETLSVLAPNNKQPSQPIPSEMVLATRGALATLKRKNTNTNKAAPANSSSGNNETPVLSHCAHYYYNRSCNRGERCAFIHAVYIDENANDHQRAPPRSAGASKKNTATDAQPKQACPMPSRQSSSGNSDSNNNSQIMHFEGEEAALAAHHDISPPQKNHRQQRKPQPHQHHHHYPQPMTSSPPVAVVGNFQSQVLPPQQVPTYGYAPAHPVSAAPAAHFVPVPQEQAYYTPTPQYQQQQDNIAPMMFTGPPPTQRGNRHSQSQHFAPAPQGYVAMGQQGY